MVHDCDASGSMVDTLVFGQTSFVRTAYDHAKSQESPSPPMLTKLLLLDVREVVSGSPAVIEDYSSSLLYLRLLSIQFPSGLFKMRRRCQRGRTKQLFHSSLRTMFKKRTQQTT